MDDPNQQSPNTEPIEWDEALGPPPTAEERAESARLRDGLADPSSTHPDAMLARALRHAVDPRPLDELAQRRLLDRAAPRGVRRAQLAAIFAAAAALVVGAMSLDARREAAPSAVSGAAPVVPHTTQALFTEPFPREGGTSARIDAIARDRGRALRHNQWTRWGLR